MHLRRIWGVPGEGGLISVRPLTLPPVPDDLAARGISLRPATGADADFLRAVYVAARWEEMQASGWTASDVTAFLHDQYRMQTLHYDRYYPDAARLVLQIGGQDAGRLILLDMATELRIVDIALLPVFRGQGTGGLLIGWVRQIAQAAGCPMISLHVEPNNPAKRLYGRLGFRVIGARGAYELMERDTQEPGQLMIA